MLLRAVFFVDDENIQKVKGRYYVGKKGSFVSFANGFMCLCISVSMKCSSSSFWPPGGDTYISCTWIVLWQQYIHALLQKFKIYLIQATNAILNNKANWTFFFCLLLQILPTVWFLSFAVRLWVILYFFFDSPSLRSLWKSLCCLPPTHWSHSRTPSGPHCRGKSSMTPSGAQIDFWREATVPPTVQSRLAPLLTSQ